MRFEGTTETANGGIAYVYMMGEEEARILKGLSARFRAEMPEGVLSMSPLRNKMANIIKTFERSLPKKQLREEPDVRMFPEGKKSDRARKTRVRARFNDVRVGHTLWTPRKEFGHIVHVIGKSPEHVLIQKNPDAKDPELQQAYLLDKEMVNEKYYFCIIDQKSYERPLLDPPERDADSYGRVEEG